MRRVWMCDFFSLRCTRSTALVWAASIFIGISRTLQFPMDFLFQPAMHKLKGDPGGTFSLFWDADDKDHQSAAWPVGDVAVGDDGVDVSARLGVVRGNISDQRHGIDGRAMPDRLPVAAVQCLQPGIFLRRGAARVPVDDGYWRKR